MFSGSSNRKAIQSGRQQLGKRRFLLAAATAVAGMWAPGAFAQSIGINFGDNGTMAPGDLAGAPGVAQTNWNNLTGNANNNGVTQAFTAGDGSSFTLTAWWGSPNTWSIGVGTGTADQRMMNGYLDSNDSGAPTNDLTSGASQPYIAISGLTGAFLNGYKVVVYADGDGTGRTGEYWLTTFNSKTPNNVSTETALTPHVFLLDSVNFNGTYTQVPITSTSGGAASSGNYIVFEDLTSSSFVLRAQEFNFRAPINGIQIIATPPVPTDEYTWNVSGGGPWTTGSNWLGGTSPDSGAAAVNFTNAITNNSTVTLGSNVTVKRMKFDNAKSYTISGGSITVAPNGGLGGIQVVSGSHTIQSTLNFNANTVLDIANGGTLNLNGSFNATGFQLTKVGPGTAVLNTSGNSWGSLSVNEGVVRTGVANVLNGGGVTGAAAGTIEMAGNFQAIRRLEGGVNISNTGGQTTLNLQPATGSLFVHSGVISGNLDLLIDGGGTQGLGGANTYNGVTTVRNTTIRTQNNRALGSTNAGTVLDQANLNLWNSDLGFEPITITPNSNLINILDRGIIRGPISYSGAGVDLLIDANSGAAGSSIQLLGTLTGNIFIGKLGNQGLVLGGNNTFGTAGTRGLQVQFGWLGVANDSVQDANGNIVTSPVGLGDIVINNAGLRTINGSHTIKNGLILEGDMIVDPASTNAADIGSVLTIGGNVDLTGGQKMVTTAGSDINFAGVVGNGGIIKAGNGTLFLSNTGNTFSSGLTMRAGKVSISQDANLGTPFQPIRFEGGLLQVTGTTLKNLNSRQGSINWSDFSGGFDIADATNTFTVAQNIGTSSVNPSAGFMRKDGAGTLLLSGTNFYTGGTTVNGGTLKLGVAGALPDNQAVTVNGGLLDLSGFSKTISSLNGTGGAVGSATGSPTLTVGANNAGGTYAGAIQNGIALTKTGTGTQILTGASTYTGPTAVNAGTLQVDGSLGNTPVAVANNATLSGKGLIGGVVTVAGGGTIAPLATQLSVGGLTLVGGSKLNFLLGDGASSSLIQVNNTNGLNLPANGGAALITLTQAPGLLGDSYDLIRYAGTLGGNFANLSLTNPTMGDTTFSLVNDPGVIRIVVGTSLLTWTGAASGDWDTTSNNWKGAGPKFTGGSSVRFDDTGAVQNVNVTAPLSAGRIDVLNPTKDYTFSGAALTGGSLVKDGRAKATFNQPLNVGSATINGGVVQLNGSATLTAPAGISLGSTNAKPSDTTVPLARGGTLFLNGDEVNRLGTAPVTLNGGSLVAAKGATAGDGSASVGSVTVNTAMGRLVAVPNGGTYTINAGSLTRAAGATGTVDFRSATGELGATGAGQIKFGTAPATSNGLIGAWATVNDNFASYDPARGVIGNETNVSTTLADAPTSNVRNTSGTNLQVSGNVTVNSLISGADVIVPGGSILTINSGAAMMSGPNKWWQATGGGNNAIIQAGSGVGQMVFTVLDPGNDHRLKMIVQNNGTPLTFIKNGDGYLNLDAANTYTGPTFVNAGTLSLRNSAALGSGTAAVTVRPGATLDLGGQTVGTREIIIAGEGVDGLGALTSINGGRNNPAVNDNTSATINVTLAGDATIGGDRRFDIRTQGANGANLRGGTYTLTKVGSNTVAIVAPSSVAVGNIVVNAGNLSFENGNNILGSTNHTATVNAGGTLTFWNNIGGVSQNKPIVLNGGIVSGDNAPTTLNGPVSLTGPATGQLRANNLLTVNGALSGAGGFSKTGGNTLVLTNANPNYTGPTNVNQGLLRVTGSIAKSAVTVNNSGTLELASTPKVAGLTVNAGGVARVPNPATGQSVLIVGDGTATATSPFSVPTGTSTGRVELNNNVMVVDVATGGEAVAMASLRDAIKPAYNAGAWNGNGLISSAVTSTNNLALGFAAVGDVPGAAPGNQFFGVTVDASSVVVRPTIAGDSNLDSRVNFTDLLSLAKNYNLATKVWQDGDFNYDGTVNFTDLLTLAKNYNQAMPTEPVPGASAVFQADMVQAFALASVPEPTSLGLLGVGAAAVLGRRRRRQPSNA